MNLFGILATLLIRLIAKSITFLTELPLSAIGVTLSFAQALSVRFYILGFVEAMVRSLPAFENHFSLL